MEPNSQSRYIIHFADGGAARRERDQPLTAGDEIDDGGTRYLITRVEQSRTTHGLGQAWAEPT